MTLNDKLLYIIEHGKDAERTFIANLTDEQRSSVGTYEKWCAKDVLAHSTYWQDQRTTRVVALASGEGLPALPSSYEQANTECFERYCNSSWDEVQAYAEQTHTQLVNAIRSLDEDVLAGPSPDSEGRTLWEEIVGVGYTHPLFHMAEYYSEHGQRQKASQLWQEWGKLVAPLDDSSEWQGLVHYNMACSLALSGSRDQALSELRQALELRPNLKALSKQDPDLNSLQSMPEYKVLYAPAYWWKAIDANPMAEALADQFMRSLSMLREAMMAFPSDEWRKGDTPYERPAGLALHIVESLHSYSVLKPGEYAEDAGLDVNWEEKDSSKLPTQDKLLTYLDEVEENLARFLADADLKATEELFRWTGSTMLSRAVYMLRHTQHHLSEMCLGLHIRGLQAPEWQ